MKVKFCDTKKTEVTYLDATETEEYFNGASRRTLTFTCAPDVASVDALNTLLSTESNVQTVECINEDMGVSNVYSDYVLKLSCGISKQLITPETPEAAAVYEDRLVLKLGKRTYIEQQLHDLGL